MNTIPEILLTKILGRSSSFMSGDIAKHSKQLVSVINQSKLLIIGAAGSIGQAFVLEALKYEPAGVHIIDISENNLVEVVRQLRSGGHFVPDDFKTYAIDYTTVEMEALLKQEEYDYVLNFSALKHVRSERDPYTLMRLLEVNVMGNARLIEALSGSKRLKKVFSVSSDKSVNPANLMGASKAFMERVFISNSDQVPFGSARFANVAFSDGSLLHSFMLRMTRNEPLSAPSDVRRYFITHEEAGQLCLLSCFLGNNNEIYYPKFIPEKDMMSFSEIALEVIKHFGYTALECKTDAEALELAKQETFDKKLWPCCFTPSDTSGEKMFEEFHHSGETIDEDRYETIGVVTEPSFQGSEPVKQAMEELIDIRTTGEWNKSQIVQIVKSAIPELKHTETHTNLDQKM